MLEKMEDFFDNRLEDYDAHQLSCIPCAKEFLAFTAESLPANRECKILDLGCGTGLELESYFAINPTAKITGIDLSAGMLRKLKEKFRGKSITLTLGSYFDVPFETNYYDAAVSVESLHHFTVQEKLPLYKKLLGSLKSDGFFMLTDFFAQSDEEEARCRNELEAQKKAQGIAADILCHYDTPLTVESETRCLKDAGFAKVKILKSWGATCTIKARK